jgi:hypothetical protein
VSSAADSRSTMRSTVHGRAEIIQIDFLAPLFDHVDITP